MTQQRQSGEERVMGEDGLHVVFGTGQVGSTLTAHLAGLGIAVRAVSRHRPPALAAGTDWRAADAADPEAAADAAKGAAVIYQCLNASSGCHSEPQSASASRLPGTIST